MALSLSNVYVTQGEAIVFGCFVVNKSHNTKLCTTENREIRKMKRKHNNIKENKIRNVIAVEMH